MICLNLIRDTQKGFLEKINNNMFLKESIKIRDQHHNGKKLKANCLIGWKLKPIRSSDNECML
jgi:hypothetical protein